MSLLRSLLARKDIWRRIALERLTEPLHLNVIAGAVAVFGGTRAKIDFDLLVRPQHAYGLLHAADQAAARGLKRVTAIELGVGSGTGLLNMCSLAARITEVTGVELELVGFDTGKGLPPPRDYRDHPEIFQEGAYAMDGERLVAALPSNARIVFGDLEETIGSAVAGLDARAPIGFVTLDVDYYSSSKQALKLLLGPADRYLPYVTMYVDDIAMPTNTTYAGELLAVSEFNREHELRKIDFNWHLVHARVFKHAEWLTHMYKVHILDHPERNRLEKPAAVPRVANPYLG